MIGSSKKADEFEKKRVVCRIDENTARVHRQIYKIIYFCSFHQQTVHDVNGFLSSILRGTQREIRPRVS